MVIKNDEIKYRIMVINKKTPPLRLSTYLRNPLFIYKNKMKARPAGMRKILLKNEQSMSMNIKKPRILATP